MAFTKEDLLRADFYSWLLERYVLPTGADYTFEGFEYLEQICKHRFKPYDEIFVEKPSQVGVSEIMLALPVWMNCRNLPKWKGSGYFFPARTQLHDHIKARFMPMFDYDNEKSRWLRNKLGMQNLRYIAINKKPIYFRSGQTRRELISIAIDCAVIDEFDEFDNPISVVPTIEARFGQSDYGILFGASTPTIPEVGIDAAFAMSNQFNWYIPCLKCGKFFTPLREVRERGFENCVVKAPLSGEVGFLCPNCHDTTQIADPKQGKWVLDEPKPNQKYAYGISKLFTPRHKLSKLLEDYDLALNLQEFYNSSLGIAFAAKNARLNRTVLIESAIGDPSFKLEKEEGTWAGVDVGKKCHWVVGKPTEGGKKQVLAYGACDFGELRNVVRRYNIRYLVIDLRPYEHEVKKFIIDNRGFLACDFNVGNQEDWFKLVIADENTKTKPIRVIKADKTQCCDVLINEVMQKRNFIFPSEIKADNGFISQMCAPCRVEQTNKDTGDIKAIYGNGGRADHYFFACVYLLLAFQMKRSTAAMLSNIYV